MSLQAHSTFEDVRSKEEKMKKRFTRLLAMGIASLMAVSRSMRLLIQWFRRADSRR